MSHRYNVYMTYFIYDLQDTIYHRYSFIIIIIIIALCIVLYIAFRRIVSRYFSRRPNTICMHIVSRVPPTKATSSTTVGTCPRDVGRHAPYVSASCRITMNFLFHGYRMRMCVASRPPAPRVRQRREERRGEGGRGAMREGKLRVDV